MLSCILVDDEKPALHHLEMLLAADGRFRVEGKYTSAKAALDHLAESPVDVAFLDIGMPEMNGLEAGAYIGQMPGDIRIVYITAYSQYAIEAFEVQALDYVLKPIEEERFAKTLNQIEKRVPSRETISSDRLMVRCFGCLSLEYESGKTQVLKWKTAKAQELFAYMLIQPDRWVAKELILDMIWQGYPYDKALTYLHTSVSQIRKLFKEWGTTLAIEYALDKYRLVLGEVKVDTAEFDLHSDSSESMMTEIDVVHVDRALALYRGDYLDGLDYDWAEIYRSRLLDKYIHLVTKLASYEISQGLVRKAVNRLLSAHEKSPYSEELCMLVLDGYERLNDWQARQRYYESFVALLQVELDIGPTESMVRCYEQGKMIRSSNLND
jgi:two-component system LytT family response regulator